MSFLNRLQTGLTKATAQATSFAKDTSEVITQQTRAGLEGFRLESECEKSAVILSSFLGE